MAFNINFSDLMTQVRDKTTQMIIGGIALYQTASERTEAAYNTIGKCLNSIGILLHWGISAVCEVAIIPAGFYYSGQYILEMANPHNAIAKWAIEFITNSSYRLLASLENLWVVGPLFSQTALPYVVGTVLIYLFISNAVEVISEQKKLVSQKERELEKQVKDHPENLELKEKLDYIKTSWLGKSFFHISTIADLGPEEGKKATAMRFVLSLAVPTIISFLATLYKVNGATALYWGAIASVVTNLWPYGLIGGAVAINNGFKSYDETWNPKDHNKERADLAAQEDQKKLAEELELEKAQGGHRLTDDNDSAVVPKPSPTLLEALTEEEKRLALKAEQRKLNSAWLDKLETMKKQENVNQNDVLALEASRPKPVLLSQNLDRQPEVVQFSTPKPTDVQAKKSSDNTPKPGNP